jgi:hypothetical protein
MILIGFTLQSVQYWLALLDVSIRSALASKDMPQLAQYRAGQFPLDNAHQIRKASRSRAAVTVKMPEVPWAAIVF